MKQKTPQAQRLTRINITGIISQHTHCRSASQEGPGQGGSVEVQLHLTVRQVRDEGGGLDIVEPLIRQFGDVALPVLKLLLGELADEERSEELVVPVQEALEMRSPLGEALLQLLLGQLGQMLAVDR